MSYIRTQPMPALFVGHGSPMNAIEDNEFSRSWAELGKALPRPRGVLCISAHWETHGIYLTGAAQPETIHDFYGFPTELFAVRYPAPGDPQLASRIAQRLGAFSAQVDTGRGLDHGAWSVLRVMYPAADIPVMQLSLDANRAGQEHYALGQSLGYLRDEGILLLASGNIVHNLGLFRFHSAEQPAWALRFRQLVNRHIEHRDHQALWHFTRLGADAELAIPTPEHYLPLLYALAVQRPGDRIRLFNDQVISAISMTSIVLEMG